MPIGRPDRRFLCGYRKWTRSGINRYTAHAHSSAAVAWGRSGEALRCTRDGAEGDLSDATLLWARYRSGDTAARCALIERYAALATRIARGMNVPVGAVAGEDDLESAALVGLIDAVDRFDPDRGVPFEGYATLRIRGAVLDEVRRVDDLGRADRRRQREAQAQGVEGSRIATVSLDDLIERGYGGEEQQDEVAERYEAEDLRMRVRSAMACLPPRQREVLERYYGDSLTLREAGLRMGISEARACQLHGRAIQNLRRTLSVVVHVTPPAMRTNVPAAA